MNHEMLLGPAIGFVFTVGTIAFVAATAKGMEARNQSILAADPDAFMFMGDESPKPIAAPPPSSIADLAPSGVQGDQSTVGPAAGAQGEQSAVGPAAGVQAASAASEAAHSEAPPKA